MIELAGRSYKAIVGSDVDRDGMYLELTDQDNLLVGEVFFSDVDSRMTVTLYQSEVPLEVIEWMVARSIVRLPPSDSTVG